jgi:hypothetical protein
MKKAKKRPTKRAAAAPKRVPIAPVSVIARKMSWNIVMGGSLRVAA